MIHLPTHEGMIRCDVCGYRNIFTDKDAHPVVPGCAVCHRCGQIVALSGVSILELLTEVDPGDGESWGVPTIEGVQAIDGVPVNRSQA